MTLTTAGEVRRDALAALAERVSTASATQPLVQVAGTVTQVTPAFCRVSGLSPFVKLGDRVSLTTGGRPQLGEVIRLDETQVTIKTFDEPIAAGLGAKAWRTGTAVVSPDPSWKGHIFNALGAPLSDGAAVLHGDQPGLPGPRRAGAIAAAAGKHTVQDGRACDRPVHAPVLRPADRHLLGLRHR